MTNALRRTRFVAIGILGAALMVVAPSASAEPPGCNWNTDVGVQACLGGGPFDAGKNGNGDTYGPTGAAGFLYDIRLVATSFQGLTDEQVLDTGKFVCEQRRAGNSEDRVQNYLTGQLAKRGVSEADVGYFVIDAEMYLCPGLG